MTALAKSDGVSVNAQHLIALRQLALRPARTGALAALPGGFTTRKKGAGQEIADVREYVIGDDLRHIDRGTTARTGVPHVRQFHEERDRVVLLVADFRAPMLWGLSRAFRSVAAAEALSLIGWRAVEDGARVGVLALAQSGPTFSPPRGRTRGMLDAIGCLARAHDVSLRQHARAEEPAPQLSQALARIPRLCPHGSEIVIASGFDDTGTKFNDQLDALQRRRTVRLLAIQDSMIDQLPPGRYPIRLADGHRTSISVGRRVPNAQKGPVRISGHEALAVDAAASVESMANVVAAHFGGVGPR